MNQASADDHQPRIPSQGASTLLHVGSSYARGVPVVTLTGECDFSCLRSLHSAIAAALDGAAGPIVVDLSGLEFCDAGSLRELVLSHLDGARPGGGLVLTGMSSVVTLVWRIGFAESTDADRLPACYGSVEEAVSALTQSPKQVSSAD